jgi:hypothetical protein
MVGRIFFGLAALLFFFAGVGVTVIPNPTTWGFFSLALGLLIGGWTPSIFSRSAKT